MTAPPKTQLEVLEDIAEELKKLNATLNGGGGL